MICYRDKAYCSAICETHQCDRNFSPTVKAQADAWWKGFGMPERAVPVQFSGRFRDFCGEYRPPVATHSAKALDAIPTHDKVAI